MFVELTAAGLGFPVGEIVDVADGIGRAYIEAGQAKPSDAMAAMRSSLKSMLTERDAALDKKLNEIKTLSRSAPGNPPPHRDIEPGEAAGDRDLKGRKNSNLNPGELVRAMYWAEAPWDDQKITDGMRDYARARLSAWQKAKQAERSEWIDRSMDHVSDDNPHGVARDGAESGSGGAPTYGYLVKPDFAADVFRVESETDVFRNLRQIPIGNAVELRYPALDQYSTSTPTRTSNTFGGVTLYRKPEDGARTSSDARISEIVFKVTDLTGMTKVSRDLLADSSIDLNAYLQDLFREAFGWRRDYDFLQGTGDGEPLGLLADTNAAVIRGGGVSGNATRAVTATITQEDLEWMISKIWPPARLGMYWILNAQAAVKLQVVKNAAGTAVFQPNSMVSQAMMPSIYQGGTWDGMLSGYPVKLTEKAPPLNTTGDLTLFSPRYFGECQRAGLEVGLTEHRYWEYDQVGLRLKMRNDGRPMMKSYIKGADGNTYSFAATLVQL